MRNAIVIVLLLAAAEPARAQERTFTAEPLEVVGEDGGERPADAPVSALATRVSLERAQGEGRSLADVLETIPSLHVRRLGGLGAYATLSIRGSTASQVAVLVDGAPAAPSADGAVALDDLAVDAFDAVEVYRGVAPLGLAGGFAIGGVVNLRTAAARAPTRAAVTAGSFGTYRLAVAAPARIGALQLQARTSVLTSRGDFEFLDDRGTRQNVRDDETARRTNGDFTRAEAGARATARLAGGARLDASLSGTAQEGGVPGLGTFQADHARSRAFRSLLTGAIAGPLGSAGTGEVRVAARADATGFRDRDNEVGLGSQDRSDRILYAGVAAPLGFALFGGLAEVVLEGSLEHLDARDPVAVVPEPGALVRRRASAGVGLERAFGPVTLRAAGSLAAVADGHELVDTPIGQRAEPGDPPLRAEPAAGLGVRADLTSWAAVRANATYSVRAPTFEELFGNSGSVQGSAALDPERALGVDAGVTLTRRRWDLSAGAYWQEVRDLIGYVQTSQRTARAENFGRARLRGLELGASARPLAWLGGRVAFGLLDAENLGDVPSQRGKRLPGRPAFDLGGAVEARLGIVGLGVDADVVAGNYLDPANLQEVPARAYLGASLRVEPVPGVLLTLWVKNVLDHRVAEVELHPAPRGGDSTIEQAVSDYGGFPLPGRALFLTLRWTQTGGTP